MSLLRKVRTLVGALVHKPFMARPEKVDLEKAPDLPDKGIARQDVPASETPDAGAQDAERVADLIAQQRREGKS